MTNRDGLGVNGIDVARESVFSFGEAARYVGKLKGTKPIALQTLWRWATRGCSGVVLETIFVGGMRCTSKEALQRFFDAVTWARASAPTSGVAPRVVSGGVAEVGDVDGVLRRAGISADEGVEP
jgi:hypothetical protein